MKEAIHALKAGGVIVLDDSGRDYYQKGIDFLLQEGFKKIPFRGMKPGSRDIHETTVFYREDNLFNL